MEKSIEKKIHMVDKQIIELYNILGSNGEKSLIEIEKQIDILRNEVDLKHAKVYKFHCCDKD